MLKSITLVLNMGVGTFVHTCCCACNVHTYKLLSISSSLALPTLWDQHWAAAAAQTCLYQEKIFAVRRMSDGRPSERRPLDVRRTPVRRPSDVRRTSTSTIVDDCNVEYVQECIESFGHRVIVFILELFPGSFFVRENSSKAFLFKSLVCFDFTPAAALLAPYSERTNQ